MQRGGHGDAFHWAAVVGLQHQPQGMDAFPQTGLVDQLAGMVSGFIVVNFPADDLAAVDVFNQIEPAEASPDAGGQAGDVPAPDRVGCGRVVAS